MRSMPQLVDVNSDLEEKGIQDPKANWSLGYCQGDGVCFSGNVNIEEVVQINKLNEFKPLVKIADDGNLSARIHHKDSRYCHWNSMTVEVKVTEDITSLFPEGIRNELSEWEYQRSQAYEEYRRQWAAVRERNQAPIREYEHLLQEWMRHGGSTPQDWSPRFRKPEAKPAPLTEPYPPEPVVPKPPHLQAALDQAEARWKEIETLANSFKEWLTQWVKDVSRELEKTGYAEIEYRGSDEAIIEFFNGNEWEFLEDGDRWEK
jgi:hypothetical protein